MNCEDILQLIDSYGNACLRSGSANSGLALDPTGPAAQKRVRELREKLREAISPPVNSSWDYLLGTLSKFRKARVSVEHWSDLEHKKIRIIVQHGDEYESEDELICPASKPTSEIVDWVSEVLGEQP